MATIRSYGGFTLSLSLNHLIVPASLIPKSSASGLVILQRIHDTHWASVVFVFQSATRAVGVNHGEVTMGLGGIPQVFDRGGICGRRSTRQDILDWILSHRLYRGANHDVGSWRVDCTIRGDG